MSDNVVLIPNGSKVYAVPVEVVEKYALEGDALTAAKKVISEQDDVTGQGETSTPRQAVDTSGRGDGKSNASF